MNYGLKISNDLYLVDLDGDDYVIDTGAPISFGNSGPISFAGITHFMNPLPTDKMDLLQEIASVPVAGLIGMDILNGHVIRIEPKNSVVIIDGLPGDFANEIQLYALGIPKKVIYPAIDVELNGNEVKAIFDTGAGISYANAGMLSNLPSLRAADDISLEFGRFTTNTYECPYRAGSLIRKMRIGEAPDQLQGGLSQLGAKAVLGPSLFPEGSSIEIDFVNDKLLF